MTFSFCLAFTSERSGSFYNTTSKTIIKMLETCIIRENLIKGTMCEILSSLPFFKRVLLCVARFLKFTVLAKFRVRKKIKLITRIIKPEKNFD